MIISLEGHQGFMLKVKGRKQQVVEESMKISLNWTEGCALPITVDC